MATSLTVLQAASRFGDFYVPRFEITAGGQALSADVVRDVLQVTYNDSITEIDSFDITVNNWDPETREFKYVGSETSVAGGTRSQRLFNPGAAEFELKMGYGSTLMSVIKGTTTTLEPSFPTSGAPTLTVRALNALHQLRTRQHQDHWPNSRVTRANMRISRIAQDVGQRRNQDNCPFPLPIRVDRQAMNREPLLDYLAQDNLFDIDFLLLEARKIGYVVYVDREQQANGTSRDVLRFGPSSTLHPGAPNVRYELRWGVSLMEFNPKLSTANQVSAVEIRSWNRQTNQPIRPRVSISTTDLDRFGINVNRDLVPLIQRSDTFGLPVSRCREREEVVVNEPQFTLQQAERRAAALLSERLKQLVEATGTTVGLPDLRSGQRIKLVGLGARFSGIYFVTKTTHTINDSGYTTKFTARREAPLPGAGS